MERQKKRFCKLQFRKDVNPDDIKHALDSGEYDIEADCYAYYPGPLDSSESPIGDVTPLMAAASYGNFELVKLLVEHGADVNHETSKSALICASCTEYHDTVKILKFLIDNGANIDSTVCDITTALIEAIIHSKFLCVEFLLASGAKNLDFQSTINDPYNATALMHAAWFNDVNSTKALVKAGANIEMRNVDGNTAFDMCGGGYRWWTPNRKFEILLILWKARVRRWVVLRAAVIRCQRNFRARYYAPGKRGAHNAHGHFIELRDATRVQKKTNGKEEECNTEKRQRTR